MQPTREGVNSRTVCQPRVIRLLWPAQREDTSTMGPGSRYRRAWLTGNSRFSGCFGIGVLSQAPLCNNALVDLEGSILERAQLSCLEKPSVSKFDQRCAPPV